MFISHLQFHTFIGKSINFNNSRVLWLNENNCQQHFVSRPSRTLRNSKLTFSSVLRMRTNKKHRLSFQIITLNTIIKQKISIDAISIIGIDSENISSCFLKNQNPSLKWVFSKSLVLFGSVVPVGYVIHLQYSISLLDCSLKSRLLFYDSASEKIYNIKEIILL